MEAKSTNSCLNIFSIWKRVMMKTMSKQPLNASMKQSIVFLMKRKKKLRFNLFHLKSSQFTSVTLMKVLLEKIQSRLQRKKRIKRNGCNQQRDLWLPRRRRQIWWLEILSLWYRLWQVHKPQRKILRVVLRRRSSQKHRVWSNNDEHLQLMKIVNDIILIY